MKAEQVSFAAGEISPVLHARTDLAKYHTALAELVNMIVLPQGGITRRAGFSDLGRTLDHMNTTYTVKLIPFEYNSTDSELLEFCNKEIRVWQKTPGGYVEACSVSSPYALSDVKDLRYVQSGNVIFLAHRKYRPQMLRRNSLTSWSIEELPFKNGPWISGEEWASDVKLKMSGMGKTRTITSIGGSVFTSGLEGTLLKVEYAVDPKTGELTSLSRPTWGRTEPFEVNGTMNVTTSGEWMGIVSIERSSDGGATWVTMRQYRRADTEKQGQWDFTLTETEKDILYRVSACHEPLRIADEKEPLFKAKVDTLYDTETNKALPVKTTLDTKALTSGTISASVSSSVSGESGASTSGNIGGDVTTHITFTPQEIYSDYGYEQDDAGHMTTILTVTPKSQQDDTPVTVMIAVSGFLKSEVLRIVSINSATTATVEVQDGLGLENSASHTNGIISLWSMGAWGDNQGYPGACAMYQDRLIFAGNTMQPQTIWMSRTGDYADFGTSDPLRDDDAVTMSLAGTNADRIHSLTATGDLLVFTTGGEWKVKGSGDSGAITPTALTAHQQTNIGTKDIQPFVAGGHVILVQTQGRKVYALGYDLDVDGYTGSELTILSSHLFEGKRIVDMAYQSEPDSLLWFVLSDGTCAVCTYNPEHDIIGWSRQELACGKVKAIAALTGSEMTELFAVCDDWESGTNKHLFISRDRRTESEYTDGGTSYESRMRTLRLSGNSEDGSAFTNEKLIARLIVSVLRSGGAWAAPGDYTDVNSWERRRKITMEETEYLHDEEVQLDNGFATDACVQIRSMDNKPLTIAAITPHVTIGG